MRRERLTCAVVAITGSSGKTSTKDLLAAVLVELGPVVAPQGSFNTEVGLPLTLLRLEPGHAAAASRLKPPWIFRAL